jgi:hypothetical protein
MKKFNRFFFQNFISDLYTLLVYRDYNQQSEAGSAARIKRVVTQSQRTCMYSFGVPFNLMVGIAI